MDRHPGPGRDRRAMAAILTDEAGEPIEEHPDVAAALAEAAPGRSA